MEIVCALTISGFILICLLQWLYHKLTGYVPGSASSPVESPPDADAAWGILMDPNNDDNVPL